jgi:hypothetical protein
LMSGGLSRLSNEDSVSEVKQSRSSNLLANKPLAQTQRIS